MPNMTHTVTEEMEARIRASKPPSMVSKFMVSKLMETIMGFIPFQGHYTYAKRHLKIADMLDRMERGERIPFKSGWFDPKTNTIYLDGLKFSAKGNLHFHSDTHVIFTTPTGELPEPTCFHGVWTNPEILPNGDPIFSGTEEEKQAIQNQIHKRKEV